MHLTLANTALYHQSFRERYTSERVDGTV